ncbi:MAG: polyketide synthase, partial [bacterium]|nr:polyketide synthase [bacterium]
MSDISGRLKNLSPEQLKLLKARLQKEGIDIEKDIKVSKEKRPPAIEPVEAREYYVVSSVQKRLCMIAQMEEVGTAYNMSWVLTLGGDLDTEWLEEVFRRLIQRHEVFRTSFRSLDINSKLVQRIHEEVEFQIRHHNPQSTDPSVHQAIVRDFSQPFDLAKAPLLRVGLIRLNETQHVLMVDTHHIISDLSSRKIIFNEFISLYKRESLPPINIQYKDFAQWLDSEAAKKELK